MSLEEILMKKKSGRVLSIQSHVVSGYVGNKCAIFPLQLHGFDVDFINSVQFSNHTQYKNKSYGSRLTEKDLRKLYEGLKLNKLNNYSWILSGYCSDESFLKEIAHIISDARSINPKLRYVCDPVLGDNGVYYVPETLTAIYRDKILPLADIVTPNSFELEQLTGSVTNESTCLEAIKQLHKLGPSIVVITSGIFAAEEGNSIIYCYASERIIEKDNIEKFRCFRFEIPVIQGIFFGTGDVFTSLLLAWLEEDCDLSSVMCKVIGSMQALLRQTSREAYAESTDPNCAQRELRLIDARLALLCPSQKIKFVELNHFND